MRKRITWRYSKHKKRIEDKEKRKEGRKIILIICSLYRSK